MVGGGLSSQTGLDRGSPTGHDVDVAVVILMVIVVELVSLVSSSSRSCSLQYSFLTVSLRRNIIFLWGKTII